MKYQFSFNSENRILLLRVEGRLTDALLSELYWGIRKYCAATNANAGVWDFSPVTECAVSPELIRGLSTREPAMDATRPRFIVAPATFGQAPSRLFEIAVNPQSPLLKFVLSCDEAFAALGLRSPQFEPSA